MAGTGTFASSLGIGRGAARVAHVAGVLLLLSLATFLLLELLPADLTDVLLGDNAQPADIALLRAQLGLDRPLAVRYLQWLGNALTGDLGTSPLTGEGVAHAIGTRLPVSLQLALYAQVIALLLAVPLGILAGYREGRLADRLISGSAFGVLAIPHFVLGLLLILLFAIQLRWFPATGYVPFQTDA